MLTQTDIRRVSAAIAEAELQTSGEIRVHVEPGMKGDVMDCAVRVFQRLKMHRTKERNGVLILVAPRRRAFVILGDTGIHDKVPPGFWESVRDVMQSHFREGRTVEGILAGVQRAGEELRAYFPSKPDDRNELPNVVTQG